jgi:hypothetical protein
MKITYAEPKVKYESIKHNEHFIAGNKEYIKFNNNVSNYEDWIDVAYAVADGSFKHFEGTDKVVRKRENRKLVEVNDVIRGEVFRYNDNFYLRLIKAGDDTSMFITVVNLETSEIFLLEKDTLVDVIDVQLTNL